MKVAQKLYCGGSFMLASGDRVNAHGRLLVLAFGDKQILVQEDMYSKLRTDYPAAEIVLCSTSGEIYDTDVFDETVSVVVIEFEVPSGLT